MRLRHENQTNTIYGKISNEPSLSNQMCLHKPHELAGFLFEKKPDHFLNNRSTFLELQKKAYRGTYVIWLSRTRWTSAGVVN